MKENIEEIISQMSLVEKAELCSGSGWWSTKKNTRFALPSIKLADGPHGLRKQQEAADHLGIRDSVEAICFPSGSALASSWDRELINKLGRALGEECQAEDISILLGPAVNIKRSPLCGRNFEYLSEDPYLTSELATEYIKGVQSQGVGTSLKHFAVNNQEYRRMSTSAELDERTLQEIYLAAFEKPVKVAQPWTVMCAYNRVNGKHCSENKYLLTDILKKDWNHQGFVVSDWGAVNERAVGIKAGLELEMPASYGDGTSQIIEAVKEGELSEKELDKAVQRILRIIFKAVTNKRDISYDKEEHHDLARSIAGECMVLLKNAENILPINSEVENIAIIGSLAKSPRYQGGGSSHIHPTRIENSYQELEKILGDTAQLQYAEGYRISQDDNDQELLNQALTAAQKSDITIVFAGLPDRYESEGYDRTTLALPPNQNYLIEQLAKTQTELVVVLSNGSPVEMPWADKVKAILEAYLGGQAAGGAAADILTGRVNPSAKLAETFPLRLSDNPSYLFFPGIGDKVEYREGVFVGYRYYDSKNIKPLFPFGHGLSYTNFEYNDLQLNKKQLTDRENLTVSLQLKNVGQIKGKEIVQLYVKDLTNKVIRPDKELKAFTKIELDPGEEATVSFSLNKRAFAYYNSEIKDWHLETGEYQIMLGSSSRDIRLRDIVKVNSTVELKKEITMNTNVGDLLADPVKKEKISKILNRFMDKAPLGTGDNQAISDDMVNSMMKYMPLRALAHFGGREISREMIEDLVVNLNN